jgi:hypothetical protein
MTLSTCRVDDPSSDPNALLGNWDGLDKRGIVQVRLVINPRDLVFEHLENGKFSKSSYTLHEGRKNKEIEIEGFDEPFIVHFVDKDTIRFNLTAGRLDAPVFTEVTYHRRR